MSPPASDRTAPLIRELGLSPLAAQCLVNRGLDSPGSVQAFLDPRLKSLADPLLIPNMAAAVERLLVEREAGRRLTVFGDYDVDGVSATAILKLGLQHLGWAVNTYLPHRMEEGYGLTQVGVENCLEQFPVSLLLAVDCGSSAVEPVAWLKSRGVDVLVLDHHQVSSPAPAVLALVNPQLGLPGEPSFRELCSAGLAFKLLHAVVKIGRDRGLAGFDVFDLRTVLDLVALGTVADLVPLMGENRILVTAGLQRLGDTKRPGLVALKAVAGVESPVGVSEVGFQLGPRLNAAGRLETAEAALELLLARDLATAEPLARALDVTNRERQTLERQMADAAVEQVRARFDPMRDYVIVEGQPEWHIGVVGIVASRVLREFHRPTLILGGDNEHWRGSGRSIPGFDLAAALRECSGLLVRHGGHAMAAGITMEPAQLNAFRERMNALARSALSEEMLIPELRLDASIVLADLTLAAITELNRLEPFGQQNPPVQVCVTGVRITGTPVRLGKNRQHLKLCLTDGKTQVDALWWNAGDAALPEGFIDVAGVPQINDFVRRKTIQLKWLDWRPSGGNSK